MSDVSKAPYQVCADLSAAEDAALLAHIKEHGILNPIEVDEAGNLLDGHHRRRRPRTVIPTRCSWWR